MASLNRVILLGGVGRDPELKVSPSGKQITRFTLATSESWQGRDGEKQEKTEWHHIVCFGKLADTVAKYVTKGKQVIVEGKLTYGEYEKDGVKKQSTDIVASSVTFVGGSSGEKRSSAPRNDTPAPDAPDGAPGGYEDDIPF